MDIIDDVEKIFAISHRYSLPNPFEINWLDGMKFMQHWRKIRNYCP